MPADLSKYSGVLIAALLLWAVYRRLRRSFGRQPLSPARLGIRAVLLGIVGSLCMPLALRSVPLAAAGLCGLAAGVLLALWGASRTHVERHGAMLYYVPHSYSGVAVTGLFLGRLAYRFAAGPEVMAAAAAPQDASGQWKAMLGSSPLSHGLLFVLVGYYVSYYSLLLYKLRHLDAAAGGPAGRPAAG